MKLKNSLDNFFFLKLPILLFVLLPALLITGPFLSDLAISLISIIFLIYCWKNKNFSYFKNKYFYFFLIFYFYLVLNSIFNNSNFFANELPNCDIWNKFPNFPLSHTE